ncbi:MAG: hypothetical protein ABEJ87_02955 [Candidatus Nanohalobium sp.]
MGYMDKIRETASERPKKFAVAVFLLLFWLLVPPLAQYFFNISPIPLSFGITVIYYIGLKTYQYRRK